jgi:pantoate--beta-alanine ligase
VSRPLVARTRAELKTALSRASSERGCAGAHSHSDEAPRGTVGLVPTMGALHAGHASLLSTARSRVGAAGSLVVSVFVNPLQFGPGEDLDRYPRSFEADLELCASEGVDVVFAPSVAEVYPGGEPLVTVEPGPLATVLEGASRPTHFRGVLTVVAKLFGLVGPDVAVFGEKDYQQLVLIRRMVADLCMGIEVVGGQTVREDGGLALSSRNRYLSTEERALAQALSGALRAGAAAGSAGPAAVRRAALDVLEAAGWIELDYLALTDPELGEPPARGPARLLVAARVGATRLIDNVALTLED